MSRTVIDTDTNGEQPPEDDRAFPGHPRGLPPWPRRTMHPVH
ncbi:hypothetical protein ACFY8X_04705 [Streptomyces tanashiensis]